MAASGVGAGGRVTAIEVGAVNAAASTSGGAEGSTAAGKGATLSENASFVGGAAGIDTFAFRSASAMSG